MMEADAMAWQWRYTQVADAAVDPGGHEAPSEPPRLPKNEMFPTQSDAETWLGEQWRTLSAAGVVSATLLDGDRVVYGPMALEV
jgi:hypothetical protein